MKKDYPQLSPDQPEERGRNPWLGEKTSRRDFITKGVASIAILSNFFWSESTYALPKDRQVLRKTVGPSGDTLIFKSTGLQLHIPPKALEKDVKIMIEVIDPPGYSSESFEEPSIEISDNPDIICEYGFSPPEIVSKYGAAPLPEYGLNPDPDFQDTPVNRFYGFVYKFSPEDIVFQKNIGIYFPVDEEIFGLTACFYNQNSWEQISDVEVSQNFVIVKTNKLGIYTLEY